MSKKLGLALGSGGARGIAHIGVLRALEEAGIKPDFIAGCSMGAIVGACYANGMSPIQIRDEALSLKVMDILDLLPSAITTKGIMRTKKVEEQLARYLGNAQIENMKIPYSCVATDVLSGKLATFKDGDAVKAVLASCSVPIIFKPLEYRGMLLVDGGCLCRVPVQTVKDMGADVVVAVDVLKNAGEPVEEVSNIITMVMRVFDVMDSNQTYLHRKVEGNECDLLIEPEMKGISAYKMKDLDKAYEDGLETAREYVDRIKELIK